MKQFLWHVAWVMWGWNEPHRWECISQIPTATAFGTEENNLELLFLYIYLRTLKKCTKARSFIDIAPYKLIQKSLTQRRHL
jgi:hypothetical protein